MTAPRRPRRTAVLGGGLPKPAEKLLCAHDGCGEPFARLYFCGLRCSYHAPREAEILAHAQARYRARHSGRRR